MTIPANWCPACEDTCDDHPSVCSICGTALTTAPQAPQRRQQAAAAATTTTPRVIPTLLEAMPELRQTTQNLQDLIHRIRQQITEAQADQERLWQDLQQARDDWQTAPAEWMDPSAGVVNGAGPATSKAYLAALPRTVLQEHSSWLVQPLVAIQAAAGTSGTEPWTVEGTMGDFGIPLPSSPFTTQGQIVLASPRTGRGGSLSSACLAQIARCTKPVLLYFDRGDVTFVQKASLAQSAGAVACLIGNHVAEPWPYIMQDSKGEASACGLTIPTLLLPKQAGVKLKELLASATSVSAHVDIRPTTRSDCVVCTEAFQKGATVVRLPECGHLFHEACALPWLSKHNTCMYCRRELPTDDADYERERRRTQRTHAGSAPRQSTEFHNFYG